MAQVRKESRYDAVMRHIDEMTGSVVNQEAAQTAVQKAIDALRLQAEALAKAKYEPKKYDQVARTMAYTAKMIDEIGRFLEFAKGNPDSRPQVELGSILQSLTDIQVAQVMKWVEENGKSIDIGGEKKYLPQ